MQNIDWTKLVVPWVNDNGGEYTAGIDPKDLNTTDWVSLPSLSDAEVAFNKRVATDFARLFNTAATEYKHNGRYLLRTPASQNLISTIREYGEVYSVFANDACGAGISPSLSLKLPANYTLADLKQQFDLTPTTIGDKQVYQVRIGGYPQTKVAEALGDKLESLLLKNVTNQQFRCTGRLYTTFTLDSIARQCPEYEYRGEKYVRVVHHNLIHTWYKVEPLTFWVENSAAVKNKTATQLDLICANVVMGNIAFLPNGYTLTSCTSLWQNSFARAFLNGTDSRQLDGNPLVATGYHWDFMQGGFLQQALDMTREPVREYTIPTHEKEIAAGAFECCRELEKIIIPSHVQKIQTMPFTGCHNVRLQIELSPTSRLEFRSDAFVCTNFAYIYIPKSTDEKWLTVSPKIEPELEKDYQRVEFSMSNLRKFLNYNYCKNFVQLHTWKANQKIKFIPPEFTLEIFPTSEMRNYFINNNHKRWAELVNVSHFNLLQGEQKVNSLTDLMKIYYALGGFSGHQGERDKAFDYVVQHIANLARTAKEYEQFELYNPLSEITLSTADMNEQQLAELVGDEVHSRFSRLVLKGPHNPTFAKFLMKYYHDNPDFMKFDFSGRERDYLCAAHNSFDLILKNYPNRVVNGNTERNLLTPQFVAKHCSAATYEDVDENNQNLALIVGQYGYTQDQFDEIQKIYNQAKKQKNNYVIRADRSVEENGISFRVLEKDDPLGFVIGDVTNCCQHIGGAGDSCVRDGYTNPDAGFLVFEESLRDENGKPTGEKRILGQAYIWYDPETQTVCYDNIEIPSKVINELQSGTKHGKKLSMNILMKTLINSADEIMTTMNNHGTKVKRVTVGKGYNDLNHELSKKFKLTPDVAEHRGYKGYTDATNQYLIRTYDETTARLAADIMNTANQIMQAKQNAKPSAERGI